MDALTRLMVAVRDEVDDFEITWTEGRLVLVACSGGPDSLALAAALARLAPRNPWRAGAVVVDHGWSAQASAAAAQTVRVLGDLGLDPVELVAVEGRPRAGGDGPEAQARTARYAALDAAAERLGAVAVLLGHTLDDQAETVLLGLGRGSGARSLAGMPARRGRYRRPLLGLRREVTLEACRQLGLDPWRDPANQGERYTRVRVRALLADLEQALGPGAVEGLARSADLLRADADALEAAAAALLEQAVSPDGGFLPGPFESAPPAIRRRALMAAARQAGAGPLTQAHALALDRLVTGARGAQAHLPSGVIAEERYGRLLFVRSPAAP